MVKSILSVFSLTAMCTSVAFAQQTQEVPALVIGAGQQVPLQQIVSIKFDASQLYVQQTDGGLIAAPLQSLTFCTTQVASLSHISAPASGFALYTPDGRLVRKGHAQSRQQMFSGLGSGIYLVRGGVDGYTYQTPAPTRAMADAAQVQALQVTQSVGIDPQLALTRVDSLTFSSDQAFLLLHSAGMGNAFPLAQVTSIDFPMLSDVVTIQYDGDQIDGINPYYFDGVSITARGAGVAVSNMSYLQEVEYQLSGQSDNGYFFVNSEFKWKATLMGLTLTNPRGSVILGFTGKKGTIKSQNGYVNTLCDGQTYDVIQGIAQKGAIFSEGQLIFSGKGQLSVTSLSHHGIASDDYVSFENGKVSVLGAAGDAVHANDSVLVQSGTITLASSSDGIDCEGPVTIRRGANGAPVLTVTTTADGAKGVKTGGNFLMTDGNVTINQSGHADKSGDDTSHVVAIKADRNITITGGTLIIRDTEDGRKGLSAGGQLTIGDAATVVQ